MASYQYPDESFSRAEGKSRMELKAEILAGGPYMDSFVQRACMLADDSTHRLHFVAKHYLFLLSDESSDAASN